MPFKISRDEALQRIIQVQGDGNCLACYVLKNGEEYILHRGQHATIRLSEYPRTWGQAMVVLNRHETRISGISPVEWKELTAFVRLVSIASENYLKPLRNYISMFGANSNYPHSCPHIHMNITPVYNDQDRPTGIFSWDEGVYSGTIKEWVELIEGMRAAIPQL